MNEPKTKSIVKRMAREIRMSVDTSEKCSDLYRALGSELGLAHHLRPECVAAVMDKPEFPEVAPELYAWRSDKKEKIIPFLRRVYASWLGKGFTRNHLSALDKQAYVAFKNHLFYHGSAEGFDFPTIDEQIDCDFSRLRGFEDTASWQALESEIVALRRIHHFLQSRKESGD